MIGGSAAIGGWIAQLVFWVLIAIGAGSRELGLKAVALFVVMWLAGFFGLPRLSLGAMLFSPYTAVLDIVLVFLIFKGDVKL
jgi:hypothetical protein